MPSDYHKNSLKKAEEEFKKGHLLPAKKFASNSIKALETVEAFELLAEIELQLKNFKEAEKASKQGLEISNGSMDSILKEVHAISIFYQRDFLKAKEEFEKLHKSDEIRLYLGTCLFELQEYENALSELRSISRNFSFKESADLIAVKCLRELGMEKEGNFLIKALKLTEKQLNAKKIEFPHGFIEI